ncbi:MAG: branched-chain amino acid ABC transporter permease [Gammaproteobacteria bacterium]|nr:branched-chain amino acid ABC transporter permease [Gammaproteobacteria bacterium]
MEVLQLLISGVSQGCVYGLIALGFVLIYKATEMVNFAQGDIMMLGAFVAFSLGNLAGLPFVAVFVLTLVIMGALGMALERGLLRPMIGEPPFAVLMLTIGLGFVIRAIAGAIWGNQPRALDSPFAGEIVELGGLIIGYENIAIVVGTALLCALLFLFFRFTRIGIAMQAASQNQLAAFYLGIPVKRVFSLVWGISAAIAAAAGILVAPVSLIDPLMGLVGIKAFAAAIVGGFGSLPGAIVGGLIIGIAEQFVGLYLPAGLSEVSAFVILLVMLFLRPEGIFATLQQKKV